ncbi:MAG: glycosyltransferase family 39 protein [Coriobacteriia bacterium]|nr:glycosyltransferase family 39 protein [Coriobacteriia bacterium]
MIDDKSITRFLSMPDNAFTMPGYPAFRAAIYKLVGGADTWRAWTRILQAIISCVGALLMYLLARRFSERAGILALAIALVYLPFSTANSHLLTDVLFTYLLVTIVYAFVRWTERPSLALAAAVGLLLGLALWVRPTIALWLGVAGLLVIVFRHKLTRGTLGQLAVIGLIAVVAISPWWFRNYALYGRFVPLSTSGNATAMEAIRTDVSFLWPFPWQSIGPNQTPEQKTVEQLVAQRVRAATAVGGESDLAQSDAYGTQYRLLRNELLPRYSSTLLRSRGRTFLWSLAWPYALIGGLRYLNILTAALHLALLLCFAAAVFVFCRRLDAMLLASVPVYLLAVHTLIIPLNRYVFPAMPFVIVLGAALLDHLIQSRSARSSRPVS